MCRLAPLWRTFTSLRDDKHNERLHMSFLTICEPTSRLTRTFLFMLVCALQLHLAKALADS
jgi:hypothetical protein